MYAQLSVPKIWGAMIGVDLEKGAMGRKRERPFTLSFGCSLESTFIIIRRPSLCLQKEFVFPSKDSTLSLSSLFDLVIQIFMPFNPAIKDIPDVDKQAKITLANGCPTFKSSFIVEISLQTKDSESLTLEVWSLSISPKYEDTRVPHAVYRKMSTMLRSLICVSRATPAYKLSRNQDGEYITCYRIYGGKADISGLGENCQTFCIGSIGTPTGTFTMAVAFRNSVNLHLSTKKLVSTQPMLVSHDHFHSPTYAPARPCNGLQSSLLGSKESFSKSKLSVESSSHLGRFIACGSSPNDHHIESSRTKAAMFTIGTPPASSSLGKTPPRKMSDVTFDGRGLRSSDRQSKSFLPAHPEQNFSDPLHRGRSQSSSSGGGGSAPLQSNGSERQISDNLEEASMHDTLTDGDNLFRPISCSPSPRLNQSRSSSIGKNVRSPPDVRQTRSGQLKNSNVDCVTALKSNSPTNAKVGFPENVRLNTHHACNPTWSMKTMSQNESTAVAVRGNTTNCMATPGAFVSNSKSLQKEYEKLTLGAQNHRYPFDELTSGTDEEEKLSSVSPADVTSSPNGLSSQSSCSSLHSNDSTPSKTTETDSGGHPEDYLMVELNPAFGRVDSVKDLCAFYKAVKNAPNLVMFEENKGVETQETLLELTKQLEDYQKDAADFDDFVRQLEAS